MLRADEIDCRVGTATDSGVSLLMYKDARVDMRLLDEVTQCVRELHRDPARAAELCELEALAETYISSRGISVALN